MCCIFTCCGWVIDLFQRFWTFTMSCFISSAVCCSFLVACMSGVALGYNYSLAEYIDLKETNVTVYLRRGIFDDEISDDMIWRRSGHMPIDGHVKEDKLITGEPDEPTSMRSGRRLDDSIFESNDKHNFEGSLMKLMAKPPDQVNQPTRTTELDIDEIVKPFEKGSLDELKAIQSAINIQKAAAAAGRRTTKKAEEVTINSRRRFENVMPVNGRQLDFDIPPHEPPQPNGSPFNINPLRQDVPDDQINQSYKWRLAKLPPQEVPKHVRFGERNTDLNVPLLVTPRAGPARPTKPKTFMTSSITRTSKVPTRSPDTDLPKSLDEEMESFREKPLLDRFDDLGIKEDDFLRKMKIANKKADEDYEDEIKGIPLRKKRNNKILASSSSQENKTIEANNPNILNTEFQSNKNIHILSKLVTVDNVVDIKNTKNIYLRKEVEVPLSNKIPRDILISSESPIIKLLLAKIFARV
ncbi:uncharacterized protein LOC112054238 [Bicyclus anynana]|uniref:Uncharacterized protein LOC112054238 n=1 Tax=Bicyclus anynana TaxID=110368 RepID=A0A6J1NWV0_BICAN|nr:uncharacterized protein LOC112054238 [Bicyclus anynana]